VVYRVVAGAVPQAAAIRSVAPEGEPEASTLVPSETERVQAERGRALFERHDCAACHDPGRATPGMVVKELRGLAGRYDVASLAGFFEAPTPPMPVFALSEEERRDLAHHLLTTYR
jgi:mono/diheme cytochrome c family protein